MTKRAIRHRFLCEAEIQEKMDKRETQRTVSHGYMVVNQRRLKRNILWAVKEVSVYNGYPWLDDLTIYTRYPWLEEEEQCMK